MDKNRRSLRILDQGKPDTSEGNGKSILTNTGITKISSNDDTSSVMSLSSPAVSQKLYTKCYICGVYSANMEKHQKIHSEPFKCLECKLNFASKPEFEQHWKQYHSKKKSIKCYYCWETFETMPLLVKHAKSNHNGLNNNFECAVCGKPCPDSHALSVHTLVHTKEKPHKCKQCAKSYTQESTLVLHMKTHSQAGDQHKYKCSVCHKGFIKGSALKAHETSHNEDRKGNWVLCPHVTPTYNSSNNNFPVFCQMCDGAAVCTFCGFSFENKQVYMAHTHTNFCITCGIKFFDGKFYKRHQLYHLNEIKLKCRACMYGFETLNSFALHNSKQHSITAAKTKRIFQCSMCAKEYSTKQNLDFHIKNEHKKERNFQCSNCKLTFLTKTQLKIHKKKHDKDGRDNQCDICDKTFHRRTDLNRHLKSHSDEKPFSCNICGVSVKSNRNLKLHMDTHSEKTYECDQCHKLFRQKCYLKVHMKIHEGSKPFQCSKCDKSFLKQQGLDEHMPTHLGKSDYQCENCEQYFCSAYSLRKHVSLKFCIEEGKAVSDVTLDSESENQDITDDSDSDN